MNTQMKRRIPLMTSFFNAKIFMICFMVTTFMVFASGLGSLKTIEDFYSILIGTLFFTLAAGLLFWASEISRKLSRNLAR